jgi:hypothetical protein
MPLLFQFLERSVYLSAGDLQNLYQMFDRLAVFVVHQQLFYLRFKRFVHLAIVRQRESVRQLVAVFMNALAIVVFGESGKQVLRCRLLRDSAPINPIGAESELVRAGGTRHRLPSFVSGGSNLGLVLLNRDRAKGVNLRFVFCAAHF